VFQQQQVQQQQQEMQDALMPLAVVMTFFRKPKNVNLKKENWKSRSTI
jgi:hypothetical protein